MLSGICNSDQIHLIELQKIKRFPSGIKTDQREPAKKKAGRLSQAKCRLAISHTEKRCRKDMRIFLMSGGQCTRYTCPPVEGTRASTACL